MFQGSRVRTLKLHKTLKKHSDKFLLPPHPPFVCKDCHKRTEIVIGSHRWSFVVIGGWCGAVAWVVGLWLSGVCEVGG